MSELNESESPRVRRLRLWPALVIVGFVGILELAVWLWLGISFEDRTLQAWSVYGSVLLLTPLLLLWWIFLSGVRWRTRFLGLFLLALVALTLRLTVRVTGYSGENIPYLGFRWNKSQFETDASPAGPSPQPSLDRSVGSAEPAPMKIALVAMAEDWPEYRGCRRDGIVDGIQLVRQWGDPSPIWKIPVGLGLSSFIVIDDYAYTQEQRGREELVMCYRASTGEEIWRHANLARFSESMGGDGPKATPTFHEGMIYAQGATGILDCLDAVTGNLVWSVEILKEAKTKNITWGMSGAPLVHEGVVVVCPGGANGNSLVAYDRTTGNRVWAAGNDPASYSSPMLTTIHGRQQILNFNGAGLASHDTETGQVLWSFAWTNQPKVNAALPRLFDDSTVIMASGYGVGAAAIRVSHENNEWQTEERWTSRRLKAKFNDFVIDDRYIYGIDEGVLACLDATNGERQWKGGRVGYGQLLLVGDLLLVQAESGEVVLVEASPNGYQPVTRFQAIEGKTWNHPAVANEKLFVRNGKEAACYKLPIQPTVAANR